MSQEALAYIVVALGALLTWRMIEPWVRSPIVWIAAAVVLLLLMKG